MIEPWLDQVLMESAYKCDIPFKPTFILILLESEYLILFWSDKAFMDTVVNLTCHSIMNEESGVITFTVLLYKDCQF